MNKHTRSVSLIDGHTEEMTDAEIKKALEICIDFVSGGEATCKNCPLYNCNNCSEEQRKQALDLINRQQAEIAELQHKNPELKAEIERLNIRNKALTDITKNYDWKFAKVKAEAIKEFAERLCEGRVSNDPVVIAVKTELKMTEEKENG